MAEWIPDQRKPPPHRSLQWCAHHADGCPYYALPGTTLCVRHSNVAPTTAARH